MIPTIFVTAGAVVFAIYKIVMLTIENDRLLSENEKLRVDNQSIRGQLKLSKKS